MSSFPSVLARVVLRFCLQITFVLRMGAPPSQINMEMNSNLLPEASALSNNILWQLPRLSLAAVAFALVYILLKQRSKVPLPPGPRGIPILGNSLQLSGYLWIKLTEWSQAYGECTPSVRQSSVDQLLLPI